MALAVCWGAGLQNINRLIRNVGSTYEDMGGGSCFPCCCDDAASEADEGRPPMLRRSYGMSVPHAHSEGCLVHAMPSGSVVTGRDYSCAAAPACRVVAA